MTSAISWVAKQVREAVGVVHEGTGLGTCWCTGCSPTLASRGFQQMFSQDYDVICQVEIVRSHSLTDNNYKVFATANTMIDAADCDTTFCTLKFPCFSPTSRHYITMIRGIKAAYELLQSIWQTVRDSGAWNLPKTFIGGHCKCYWQNDRWEERCRRMVVRPMNKFQIENPETSYKDDCWTLFMGRRPPGDLKLAPAVAEGYESGGRYEC